MFKFTLQSVLEVRCATEEQRRGELARVLDKVAECEIHGTKIQAEIARGARLSREALSRGAPYAYRELFENWIAWGESEMQRLEARLSEFRAEAEKRRLVLAAASRERTILDKLRDKEMQAYRREMDRAEQRHYDDLAIRDYALARRADKENLASAEERISS